MRRIFPLLLILVLVGCASLLRDDFRTLFGPSDPTRFDTPARPLADLLYQRDVQPILDQRCVVCHACNDAPCQLNLASWHGVVRGASKAPVYDGARLLEAEPSRLHIDARMPSQWRERGFHPVLNEHPRPGAELQAALLARVLDQKTRHPLPADQPAPDSLDFSLHRAQQCPAPEEFSAHERKNPLWGMPFGLPALSGSEEHTLRQWMAEGAPYEGPTPLGRALQAEQDRWERYFNGESLRERLVSRYLYEHLFLAHLHFPEVEGGARRFFRLVRSTTPPGQVVREIASRRPFDDPGVARVYYRLVAVQESIVAKTHMPYALHDARMRRWNELFYRPTYRVESLPGYEPELAANPFLTFRELPLQARYRFLLDEAQFTIMGFIKGPVCRGQTALNVINDHFWVFFLDPAHLAEDSIGFLERESRNLALPSERGSRILAPAAWQTYAAQERKYLQGKSRFLDELYRRTPGLTGPGLDVFWHGDGHNPNAALTVYRHFDSATVLQGLVGETPKTAWVFGYPLLERVHYLLVAGYDVYGNLGHQVHTRLYMDFLRMEGEHNFISKLPRASREAARDRWYRGADDDVKDFVFGRHAWFNAETAIPFTGQGLPEHELMQRLAQRLQAVLPQTHALSGIRDERLRQSLRALSSLRGSALAWMPEASFLRIDGADGQAETLTLLRNTAHLNVTHLFSEDKTLVPEEFSLDVLNGYVGAYPNAFFRLSAAQLPAFREAIAGLRSEADYRALFSRFGVRRTAPGFWAFSDALHADYARRAPVEAGLFDYNRLENR